MAINWRWRIICAEGQILAAGTMSSPRPPSVLANTIEAIARLQLFVAGLPFPPSLPRPRPVLEGTWCLTSTETTRLIRDGEKGEGGMEVG